MNRAIKFRAWHEETRMMLEVYEIVFTRAGTSVRCKGSDHRHFGTQKNIPLMQYTGLKDKNGREIYEGDVLEFAECVEPHRRKRGRVVWGEDRGELWGCAFGVTLGHRSEAIGWQWAGLAIPEILGNIYEHPELLKEGIHENTI